MANISDILLNNKWQSEKVVTATVSTSTYNVDLSLSNIFNLTFTSSSTISFTNLPPNGICRNILLILKQDAAGGRVVSFSNTKWTDGVAPALTTTTNAVDVVTILIFDGTNRFGSFVMADVK